MIRKDNVVLFKSNRYRVPKGKYEPRKSVHVVVKDETVTIIDTNTGKIYATHPLCHEKGKLIGKTRNNRDISKSQRELEDNILKILGNSETSKEFLKAIHKEKSRYYRDQLGVISDICLELTDISLIKSSIAYCMERCLYSAGDFKSAMLYLNELNNNSIQAVSSKVNRLPEKYRTMSPQIRNLNDYEDAMKGDVI